MVSDDDNDDVNDNAKNGWNCFQQMCIKKTRHPRFIDY